MKFINDYYGPYKITDTADSSEKTYSGKKKIILICGDKNFTIPLEMANSVVSKKKTDLTQLREARVIPVVEKLLTVLVESELTQLEMSYATGPKLTMSLNESFRKASEILWKKDKGDITLMDIQKVLSEDNKKNKK